jgi:hypothetical protein
MQSRNTGKKENSSHLLKRRHADCERGGEKDSRLKRGKK